MANCDTFAVVFCRNAPSHQYRSEVQLGVENSCGGMPKQRRRQPLRHYFGNLQPESRRGSQFLYIY